MKKLLLLITLFAISTITTQAQESWLDANTDNLHDATSIIIYVLTLILAIIGGIIGAKYFSWTLSWVDTIFMSGEDMFFGKAGSAILGFLGWGYFGYHLLCYWGEGIESYIINLF